MKRLLAACARLGLGLVVVSCSHAATDQRSCTEALAADDCGDLSALLLPLELPASRGNAHADSFDAALLGFRVFFDARFSKDGTVRCESCHSVDHGFSDAEAVPVKGLGPGTRNAPTVVNAARHRTTFWDGHGDSLWSQPLMAFENPNEMGTTRLEIVHLVQTLYTKEYEEEFGNLPDFSDASRFAPVGKPGDAAFDAMTAEDQLEVNRVVANVGKALEAYVRKLAAGPSRVDRYLAQRLGIDGYGAADELSLTERRGLAVFVNAGCLDCHRGPTLSDDKLHNLGVPALADQAVDEGLTESAVDELTQSVFNAAGPFFDGGPATVEPPKPLPGAFRTPSLRNARGSAPYGHDGTFATLEDVVDFHLSGGGRDPNTFAGSVDPALVPRDLSAQDRKALLEFLDALDGDYPPLPWGQWPNGNG